MTAAPYASYALSAPPGHSLNAVDGSPVDAVFVDTGDPDYRKILALCQMGKENLDQIKRFDMPGFRPNVDGHGRQLKLAAAEIAAARRPVILAGHGVLHARAWDELLAFAEKAQIPVAWTLLGIGVMDEEHPLAYGYMGMHGWKHVNRAIQSADLLFAIGMRFDDRVTGNLKSYAPHARIGTGWDPLEMANSLTKACFHCGLSRMPARFLPSTPRLLFSTMRSLVAPG